MKNVFKKLLSIPSSIVLSAAVSLATIAFLAIQGNLDAGKAMAVSLIGAIVGMSYHYGSVVVKSAVSAFLILYLVSIYTFLVSNIYSLITQPFLLSLAAIAIFLAQTYGEPYTMGIRSRSLWSLILGITVMSIKIAFLFMGFSYWVIEALGLNILTLFISLWRLWIRNSKKTKIIEPEVVREVIDSKFRYVYISHKLNMKDKTWDKENKSSTCNAYPYIYNKVIKAYEEDVLLVIVSEADTSELYDLGEIIINKSTKIPYLYMEAKEKYYFEEIIERFTSEITLGKKD